MHRRGDIRIGISGWTYPPWRGTFYPSDLPAKRELYYASRQVNSRRSSHSTATESKNSSLYFRKRLMKRRTLQKNTTRERREGPSFEKWDEIVRFDMPWKFVM